MLFSLPEIRRLPDHDRIICEFDMALRTVFASARSQRKTPGSDMPETVVDESERHHVAALMRVNHVGEVCAQALYQGQSMSSHDPSLAAELKQAANEETEHLAWTEERIRQLGGRKSLLNPFWYGGALAIGILAGRFGDAWNLGFLAETERQVESHLDGHLQRIAPHDTKSSAILQQMKEDEVKHAHTALRLGGRQLPSVVKSAMRVAAKVMTTIAHRV